MRTVVGSLFELWLTFLKDNVYYNGIFPFEIRLCNLKNCKKKSIYSLTNQYSYINAKTIEKSFSKILRKDNNCS